MPFRKIAVLSLVTLSCTWPATLAAQQRTVAETQTVRLKLQNGEPAFRAVITTLRPGQWTVQLADFSQRDVLTDSILSVEVLEMHRRTGRGALIGGAAGAAIGIAVWVATEDAECDDAGELCDAIAEDVFDHIRPAFAVLSTGTGILAGALIGSLVKSERWVPASMPGTGSPRDGASLGIRLPVHR